MGLTPAFALLQGRAKRGELLLQLDGHPLCGACLAHEDTEVLLEAVALAAVGALVEVRLGFLTLRVGEHPVHEGLHYFLAVRARVVCGHATSPPTAWSAMPFLRIRRPRCNRDITVPIGMSRICAASAYVKSPMSTSTTTSRKSCGTSESAETTSFCESRSTTRSSSVSPSVAASSLL